MRKLLRLQPHAERPEGFRHRGNLVWNEELMRQQLEIVQGSRKKHDFKQSRWKTAKDPLLADTGGKCAYCEAPTTAVAYGDVEHYRPKSVYWWLAYNYDNYLASCQICNQKFKSDAFPIQNAAMVPGATVELTLTSEQLAGLHDTIFLDFADPATDAVYAALHQAERPLLLNPYLDEPLEFFWYKVDDVLKEVHLQATPGKEPFLEAAEKYYGLNRSELAQLRHMTYRAYKLAVRSLDKSDVDSPDWVDASEFIQALCAPGAAFSGMVLYFERVRVVS